MYGNLLGILGWDIVWDGAQARTELFHILLYNYSSPKLPIFPLQLCLFICMAISNDRMYSDTIVLCVVCIQHIPHFLPSHT